LYTDATVSLLQRGGPTHENRTMIDHLRNPCIPFASMVADRGHNRWRSPTECWRVWKGRVRNDLPWIASGASVPLAAGHYVVRFRLRSRPPDPPKNRWGRFEIHPYGQFRLLAGAEVLPADSLDERVQELELDLPNDTAVEIRAFGGDAALELRDVTFVKQAP
jgi:hypothetical protein